MLQIPIVRGRSFTAQDGPGGSLAVVINEAMARRYFAAENPIGQRISVLSAGPGRPTWQEIVGVFGNVRQKGLDTDVFPEIQVRISVAATS